MNKEFHVSKTGNDMNEGSKESPFLTISKAASVAEAGSTVIVHEGEYREWVKPLHGGRSKVERITYMAAPGEKVVIKGSEQVSGWQKVEGSVWKISLPNSFFGSFNPFKEELFGDWVVSPLSPPLHLGDLYVDGKSYYEASSLEALKKAERRETGMNPPWTKRKEYLLEPERSVYQWYAQVGDETTEIWGNFQELDPNKALTEISVRMCCFYPEKTGLNYITVRGFEMAQAATPWAPPTADQPGMIGPHWAKGWIIEDNILHDAKCSAVSLGKEASTGHNLCSLEHRKPGYQHQMEAVFRAYKNGWSKEKIGSHLVRNNTIYDCGQNGIVGHMGCVFSEICDNHIYNIAVKHEFFGYEIGGIKLHAAIDVQIHNNNIHNCTLGTWLDWETQGTRISRNLYYANDRDLMVEVSHGPYIVDNNIFASSYNFDNISQGGAYIHNLCCGTMRREAVLDRSTPYHLPHSTDVLGTSLVFTGDDRLYNNIFVGGEEQASGLTPYSGLQKRGTYDYDRFMLGPVAYNRNIERKSPLLNAGCPASWEEYQDNIRYAGPGDHEEFFRVMQPAYMAGNHYAAGAKAFSKETGASFSDKDPACAVTVEADGTYLTFNVPDSISQGDCPAVSTEMLGATRISEGEFEAPDSSPIRFDTDYLGNSRGDEILPGPFCKIKPGLNRIKVWQAL